MRLFLLPIAACFYASGLNAQNNETETEIRQLEQAEVKAVLQKDSAALLRLWDADYVVNAPDNVIYAAGKTTLDRPVLKTARTSFTREVERVTVKGNFAFSMGSETVVSPGGGPVPPGQLVKRRFTNVWEKQPAGWKLVARHANVVCGTN